MKLLPILIFANAALVLGWINFSIFSQEQVARTGKPVILELGPRDPRSLMQGDYMILNYKLDASGAQVTIPPGSPTRGHAVLKLDDRGVARFARLATGANEPLAEGEILIRYRQQRSGLRVAPQSYFFQEGRAEDFQRARYAQLKLSEHGNPVMVGLLDIHSSNSTAEIRSPLKMPRCLVHRL